MSTAHKPYTFDRVVRMSLTAIALVGAYFLLDYLSTVLVPFAVALLIAYLMNPLVTFIQERVRVRSRGLSVFVALVLVAGVLVGLLFLLVPLIGQEVKQTGEMLTKLAADAKLEEKLAEYFPEGFWLSIEGFVTEQVSSGVLAPDQLENTAVLIGERVLPGVFSVFGGVLNFLLGLLGLAIILLYLIFILGDYKDIKEGWPTLIPQSYRGRIKGVVEDVRDAMNNYFRAQALIASLVGVLFAFGFWLIGLPLGIVLGIFVGVLNLVPYLQNIAIVPAVFLGLLHSLETGGSFWNMLGLIAIVFIVVQVIQDGFLTPKIMGNATGLNPVVILLSLSIWGKLLGFLGLIIAIPITYLLVSYYRRFLVRLSEQEEPV